MITTINKVNKDLYNQLFADVQEWLYTHNANGDKIPTPNTLEEYFNDAEGRPLLWYELNDAGTDFKLDENGKKVPEVLTSLEELFTFMNDLTDDFVAPDFDAGENYAMNQNHAWMYTRLPLDEEPFYIDANTRTITVPSNYVKNGIAVQGDEVAEVLFFKINRFFDATDLATCRIYVQWKTSPSDKSEGKTGVSYPWIVDIISEPGYLIFGWPISSKITEKAGDVTFSVRFFNKKPQNADREIAYSFSTLDQKVAIKPALNYDIASVLEGTDTSVIIDDASTLITERAVNSPDTSSDVNVEPPVWTVLPNNKREANSINNFLGDDSLATEDRIQLICLGEEDGFKKAPIFIHIQAESPETGVVTYDWKKADRRNTQKETAAGEVPEDYNSRFYKVVDLLETTDESRQEDKKYWYYDDNGAIRLLPADIEFTDGVAAEPYGQIYDQKVSTACIDEIGIYRATAYNRVGRVKVPLNPDPIVVPGPVTPVLGELRSEDDNRIIDANGVELGLESIQLDATYKFPINVDSQENLLPMEDTGAAPTYEWQYKTLAPEDEVLVPKTSANSTEATFRITSAEGNDTPEGYYRVKVYSHLNNNDYEASAISNWVRVTNAPVVPQVVLHGSENIRLADATANGIKVDISGLEQYRVEDEDSVSYQWYFYMEADSDAQEDFEKAKNYEYELHNDIILDASAIDRIGGLAVDDEVINSALTDTLIPKSPGFYFCVVTNHYNGSEASILSPFYNVQMA